MTRAAPISTDEVLTSLCKALNEGMDRFEARGETYESIVEKHREAVNKIIHENGRMRRGKSE